MGVAAGGQAARVVVDVNLQFVQPSVVDSPVGVHVFDFAVVEWSGVDSACDAHLDTPLVDPNCLGSPAECFRSHHRAGGSAARLRTWVWPRFVLAFHAV